VSSNVRVLVMDEPTSGLSAKEQEALFAAIRRLVESGVSIVYVSHKMNEVYRICDRITVLREGRNVAEFDRSTLDPAAVVEAIVGARMLVGLESNADAARRPSGRSSAGSLVVEGLRTSRLHDVGFEVARGEILGLYGVVGSGVSEVAEALFGARPSSGVARLDGRVLRRGSPVRARREGVAFVPADHRERGLVSLLSIRENVLMGRGTWRRDFVRRLTPGLRQEVAGAVSSLQVKCRDVTQRVSELSGGNQQKVVFARWILERPDVLVLEDPTQGIDVGAKVDMFAAIRRQRDRGAAVVFISSEVSEIVAVADRVLVIRDGAVVGELEGDALEERRIIGLAAGS
jgi:monosaccharide-transporting ATPase